MTNEGEASASWSSQPTGSVTLAKSKTLSYCKLARSPGGAKSWSKGNRLDCAPFGPWRESLRVRLVMSPPIVPNAQAQVRAVAHSSIGVRRPVTPRRSGEGRTVTLLPWQVDASTDRACSFASLWAGRTRAADSLTTPSANATGERARAGGAQALHPPYRVLAGENISRLSGFRCVLGTTSVPLTLTRIGPSARRAGGFTAPLSHRWRKTPGCTTPTFQTTQILPTS